VVGGEGVDPLASSSSTMLRMEKTDLAARWVADDADAEGVGVDDDENLPPAVASRCVAMTAELPLPLTFRRSTAMSPRCVDKSMASPTILDFAQICKLILNTHCRNFPRVF